MERRLRRRKWKWILHGGPNGHHLSAITPQEQDESQENNLSLFLSTSTGSVFEYKLSKHPSKQKLGEWMNHEQPQHAKVARGIQGVQLQLGRLIFALDDGRLGELHPSNIDGEYIGPTQQIDTRKKAIHNYEWSIIETPKTEGWNAEYCTDSDGPSNCAMGTNDIFSDTDNELKDSELEKPTRRRKAQERPNYLSPSIHRDPMTEPSYQKDLLTESIDNNFRMRTMHAERSFFLVTNAGLTFEYIYSNNIWLWLRHEYVTGMKGALGIYNGSMYLVDTNGNLLIRERNGNELSWVDCTSMKGGRHVATGVPWDAIPGDDWKAATDEQLFFINRKGRLQQFTVALRRFKWKDCQNPSNMRIAFILDQGVLRKNIVFVVGINGRLYQYNKVTELWHEHHQSPHLVLSRNPGTALRPSQLSLSSSLFMNSDSGTLIEYQWKPAEGWNWVEHGTPKMDVTLVGAPGPCFQSSQIFLVGSDGHVYRRYLDDRTWKWANHGYPRSNTDGTMPEYSSNCDDKVAAVQPIRFSDQSVIFQLRDKRVAELRRWDDVGGEWEWSRIIGTPTSTCLTEYWTAMAS